MGEVPHPVTCSLCSAEFPSRNRLFKHIRQQHRDSGPIGTDICAVAAPGVVEEKLVVFWEDECVVVFVKPQGMATMSEHHSMLKSDDLLLSPSDMARSDVKKAIPAHRLDKDTGGLVVCSKTKAVDAFLKKQFMDRRVSKRYMAVVAGDLQPSIGSIDIPLGGQECCTRYEVLQRNPSRQFGTLSTVNLWPVTGRMHQLRRHLMLVGHHIIGERRYASCLDLPHDVYNRPGSFAAAGDDPLGSGTSGLLYLWAVEITFPHPQLVDANGDPHLINLALPSEPEAYNRLRRAEADAAIGKRRREVDGEEEV